MHLWDLVTWQHIRTLPGHNDAVMDLTVSPSGGVFSCSWDGSIREWDRSTWASRLRFSSAVSPLASACPVMMVGCCRGDLVVSDMDGLRILREGEDVLPSWRELRVGVRALAVGSGPAPGKFGSERAFRAQGRLFTGHTNGEIRVWNTVTWEYVGSLWGHQVIPKTLSVKPYIVSHHKFQALHFSPS
ncbi:WD40-repeat-containing domain protein [Baffinella frigidus]|nr:WD40-repeat-containing domain protein [Cryptophyta sp. CCMP2293]